jgi:hypothetical protein
MSSSSPLISSPLISSHANCHVLAAAIIIVL